MSVWDLLLCAAALVCTSGRGALLLLIVLPLTLLFLSVTHHLWQWWGLANGRAAACVLAVGIGGALWRFFSALTPQNATDLGPVLPLCVIFLICAAAAEKAPSAGQIAMGGAALLITGCVRELLSHASLFGFLLPFEGAGPVFGRAADGSIGAGGVLVAAAVVWLFRRRAPLQRVDLGRHPGASFRLALLTAVIGLFDCLRQEWLPTMADSWRFWGCVLLAALPFFCRPDFLPTTALFLVPTLVCSVGQPSPLTAVALGLAAAAIWALGSAVVRRFYYTPLSRGFAVPSAVLTATAILTAVRTAL